jgi:hypothetical protein
MTGTLRRLALAAALCGIGLFVPAGPLGAQDADTPLDRSLQKVEALLTALKAKGGADPELLKSLEGIAKDLRDAKAAVPPPAGGEEGGGGGGATGAGAFAGLGADLYGRLVERTFRDVELNEKDRKLAEALLKEFAVDYQVARTHSDYKSRIVIREDVEDRFDRNLPKKEAGKLKTNLQASLKWVDNPWGRR